MPGALRHRIQTPVHAVGEIDVRGARALEQAGVAARAAGAIAMGRGIIGAEVGFGLDDSTGGAGGSAITPPEGCPKPPRELRGKVRGKRSRPCGAFLGPPVSLRL